jgi:hypothetical protein
MKVYLGDGVYAKYSTATGTPEIILTTEDGERITNRIVLEFDVVSNLIRFVESLGAGR